MDDDNNKRHNDTDATSVPRDEAQSSRPRPKTVDFLMSVARRKTKVGSSVSSDGPDEKDDRVPQKATLGILADKETDEVPGTVLLLSPTKNEPLGFDRMEGHKADAEARSRRRSNSQPPPTKRTADGKIVLEPQPEESPNDPLNWPAWRRDLALLSLGYYSMIGGGMTPILAAGFNDVAATYSVSYSRVALTTGLYMMGLGIGSVIFSPTAILWGKRPVYLLGVVLFILSTVWCALAPSYTQLVIARIFQGIAVSPVECLPSSTIAEIFFLHERAFRVGIYTLLLLGGKNLIPLVSAAIIQSLGWRWVFWIVAVCVGFGGILLFLFVPETFWDRTPRPKKVMGGSRSRLSLSSRVFDSLRPGPSRRTTGYSPSRSRTKSLADNHDQIEVQSPTAHVQVAAPWVEPTAQSPFPMNVTSLPNEYTEGDPKLPHLHNLNSPYYSDLEKGDDYFSQSPVLATDGSASPGKNAKAHKPHIANQSKYDASSPVEVVRQGASKTVEVPDPKQAPYTYDLRKAPPKSWIQSLKPFNGRISQVKWWRVACRPFVLYAYPAVLWSAMVYALSVGWLIVLSESVAKIYENRQTYNFSAIQTGLVYISPFIGGVLGTAVAGKFSDVIVRYMSRRNGGVYEPEFRLVMAVPITMATAVGLMGFGWSAQERDNFFVPTIFFGVISFGCCIGSTTAITFTLDSYRQFAGEALVTLNFSKNVLHGLVWSLFFPSWLRDDGSKKVFLAIGAIQIACMLTTIPMYMFGKRARMWTVRRKMMERF